MPGRSGEGGFEDGRAGRATGPAGPQGRSCPRISGIFEPPIVNEAAATVQAVAASEFGATQQMAKKGAYKCSPRTYRCF
jgi:hypothetical protein